MSSYTSDKNSAFSRYVEGLFDVGNLKAYNRREQEYVCPDVVIDFTVELMTLYFHLSQTLKAMPMRECLYPNRSF